ncbi:hypothetical protein FVEG_03947 [Fusarium verticillioides 7600]|uniref:Uncharacterized protein n=1 Tax=Gibberella moniliformis (strain M3125 / FGSC 7600) TaxID=334819 RepID=W7LTU1_GIBM7|nr:hypothetical protein FVEG_03947 [Fusarium verticillioides 7600]EWG41971.1 hypothetical protein FVEG_03947 [Fusarium verticillioides 7600]
MRISSSACGSDRSLVHVCDDQSLCFTSLPAQTIHEASLSQKSRLKYEKCNTHQTHSHMTHSRRRSSTVRRGENLDLSFQLRWVQY